MKNWLPPLFGWPVFAMLSVPGALVICGQLGNSSGIDPSGMRLTALPSQVYCEPGAGPPVPACRDLGSRLCGQPNCSMKPSITRWKCSPS